MPSKNASLIQLDPQHTAIVDTAFLPWLQQWDWKAIRVQRSWYARCIEKVQNHQRTIYMHRLIASTPAGQICHHRNRNSLDNRRANLLNMPQKQHQMLHYNNTLLIQREPGPPP